MAKPSIIFSGKTTGVTFRAALVHHEDKIPRRSTNLTPRISPSPLLPESASSLIRDGHILRLAAYWGFVTIGVGRMVLGMWDCLDIDVGKMD
uniref:Uncharacterized protein n=1 Tax=Fagus sylvatica TaxID=28930 RepID=A0A2N9F245_FAGSY